MKFVSGAFALSVVASCASAACAGKIQHAGVQLFGLANDVSILGSAYSLFESTNCNASFAAYPYIDPPEHYYPWRDMGFNLFRLPIAWQHAQTSLGGPLNETNMGAIDGLIHLITEENNGFAILDIHNYARWYCSIIGQPENDFVNPTGPNVTDDHFIDLWTKLANRYKTNPNVLFQLMNEPHDLNITKWASTMQKAILAIREVTKTQPILVSGTSFARLNDWPIFSGASLLPITDPAHNLLFDFHQYFDDLAGAYGICSYPWSSYLPGFENVTTTLRKAGARGILTEFGAAPVPNCVGIFEGLLEFLEENQDVWYGWTAWGSWLDGSVQNLSVNKSSVQNTLTKVIAKFAPLQ